jgi:hypothetical protein
MHADDIKQQAVKFLKARSNLMLVIVLTVINIFIAASGSDIQFLFAAAVPMFIVYIAWVIAFELGNNIALAIGVIIALIGTGSYLLCWFLAKKWRVFILIALILFSMDTIVYALVLANISDGISLVLGVAIRAWVLYYLVTGTIAWAKLRKVSLDEIKSAQEALTAEAEQQQAEAALNDISQKENDSE